MVTVRTHIVGGRRRAGALVATIATLAFAVIAPASEAKPGDLDPSFGDGGRVRASVLPTQRLLASLDMVGLPDGRIAVAAGSALYVYLPNGQPDLGFGSGGSAAFVDANGSAVPIADLAVDGQGRMLAVGREELDRPPPPPERPNATWLGSGAGKIARFLPDGRLDPTFGEEGVVVTDFGLPPAQSDSDEYGGLIGINGVAVDRRERIVLTGSRTAHVRTCRPAVMVYSTEAFLARLDAAGAPDTSFNQTGVMRLQGMASAGKPTLDGEDGVYFKSTPDEGCGAPKPRPSYIVHLESDGTPDSAFGRNGWRALPDSTSFFVNQAIALDARGRLLLFGRRQRRAPRPSRPRGPAPAPSVLRLETSGGLDRSFGEGGVATISDPGAHLQISALAIDGSGRILAAGTRTLFAKRERGAKIRLSVFAKRNPGTKILLVRLGASGLLDPRFGGDGQVTTGFGGNWMPAGKALLVSGARAVVGGSLRKPYTDVNPTRGFALARYVLGR